MVAALFWSMVLSRKLATLCPPLLWLSAVEGGLRSESIRYSGYVLCLSTFAVFKIRLESSVSRRRALNYAALGFEDTTPLDSRLDVSIGVRLGFSFILGVNGFLEV